MTIFQAEPWEKLIAKRPFIYQKSGNEILLDGKEVYEVGLRNVQASL